jgi:hypothetical protein
VIIDDIQSIVDYISPLTPSSTFIKQEIPPNPGHDTFVIRLINDSRRMRTNLLVETEREYQIVYFSESLPEALFTIEQISRKMMYGQKVIPIKDSLRYLRIESFSFSAPLKMESSLYAVTGILETVFREARDVQQWEKIMHVHLRVNE